MSGRLPERIASRLRLPLIVAPMLHVSGVELVAAACRSGAIGAFPVANPGRRTRSAPSSLPTSPPSSTPRRRSRPASTASSC